MSAKTTARQIVTIDVPEDIALALAPVLCLDCETYIPLGWVGNTSIRCSATDRSHRALDEAIVNTYDRLRNAEADAEAALTAARRVSNDVHATDVVRVGKSRTEWTVQQVMGEHANVFVQHPGRRIQKYVAVADLTLVAKGGRYTDFYKG